MKIQCRNCRSRDLDIEVTLSKKGKMNAKGLYSSIYEKEVIKQIMVICKCGKQWEHKEGEK